MKQYYFLYCILLSSFFVMGQDTDSDGLNDSDEPYYGCDINNPDTDGDGLLDGDEVYIYGTDPTNDDSDFDGLKDNDELNIY